MPELQIEDQNWPEGIEELGGSFEVGAYTFNDKA